VLACFAFTIGTFAGGARAQEEGERVILVLDASGSMWGQIDGRSKIDIAKEVIGKLIAVWQPKDEIGLVVYGHREKGSCEDIEVLREPGPLDAASFMAAVNGISPKGKTPMTAAVRLAAESLKYTEKKATVVLVSDGIETCGLDPCSVAAEMEKIGVGLTVHTIGFGVDDEKAKPQLECLAEETGGNYVTADNADELEIAITQVIDEGGGGNDGGTTGGGEEVSEFNFIGHVRMAEGVELSKPFDGVAWEFARRNADGSKGEWVRTEYGIAIKIKADPGDYVLTVTNDAVKVTMPVTIEANKTLTLEPSLEAGIVSFKGQYTEEAKLAGGDGAWEITTSEGTWVATKYGSEAAFLLSAGSYIAKLSLGNASDQQPITIIAGQTQDVVLSLGAGTLAVAGVFAEGGPDVSKDLTVEISEAARDISGQRKWVATKYDAISVFQLPAGKYAAKLTVGFASAEQEAEVKPGQQVQIKVNLNAGYIAATSAGATEMHVLAAEKDIQGEQKEYGMKWGDTIDAAFNAGKYVVRAVKDGTVLGEKTVEVAAGKRSEVTIP
jgi:Ca-activated chloride channel family protein